MLFEGNTFYIMARFLLILCGTFGMVASTARLGHDRKRNIFLFVSYLVYAFASTLFFVIFWGYAGFLKIFLLTITIPAVMLMYVTSDEPLARLVFVRVTQILFSIYVAGSATLLNTLLRGNILSSLLLLALFYALVITLEFLFLRKNFLYIADTIQKGWGILSLIPCSFVLLTLFVGLYPEHYTKSRSGICLSYLLLAVILVIYFAIFLYLNLLYSHQRHERDMELLQLQVQNIRREQENVQALAKQTKIIRHDTRHMLSVIASFAEKGDTQAILDYTDGVLKENAVSESVRYCSDPILDATFSSYFGRAKNLGFSLDISLSLPDTPPVDPSELAICFANALESALDAGSHIPEKERKLVIKCMDQPKLLFEVAAYCRDMCATRKNGSPPGQDRDLNTISIRSFCGRYDAVSSFSTENGWFKIIIAL